MLVDESKTQGGNNNVEEYERGNSLGKLRKVGIMVNGLVTGMTGRLSERIIYKIYCFFIFTKHIIIYPI